MADAVAVSFYNLTKDLSPPYVYESFSLSYEANPSREKGNMYVTNGRHVCSIYGPVAYARTQAGRLQTRVRSGKSTGQ